MATHEAGADVDAYCSKCKLTLAHVIIALKAGKPARVECKTCGAVHAYKKAPKTAKKKKKKSRSSKSGELSVSDYERLMSGRDISAARRYKTSEQFELDEVLDHKKFGLGLVTKVLSDNKIQVLTPTGMRILIHGR